MSMASPVSCFCCALYLYHVVCFLILCIYCHQNNRIQLMMSLTMMGLTPDILVCTLFATFLCILKIPLVVLVVWGLLFLYQQESSPNSIVLCLICSYQYESNPKVVDSFKCFGAQIPYFISKFETQFYSYSRRLTTYHSLLQL